MGQTIRSRRLGSALRQLRRRASLTAEAVGAELGFSQSKMSHMESGDVRVSRTDLKALLALYNVTDQKQITAFLAVRPFEAGAHAGVQSPFCPDGGPACSWGRVGACRATRPWRSTWRPSG
ncbi:helix-turn-helix transcriptional regulator [Streptomyces cyaneofuscatus]|uniref:helix-turn-helix domain-containing protein n=1 Tax=Streptomyces cyaneofuscatus TaxID=66883 RepID=UPI0033EEBB44